MRSRAEIPQDLEIRCGDVGGQSSSGSIVSDQPHHLPMSLSRKGRHDGSDCGKQPHHDPGHGPPPDKPRAICVQYLAHPGSAARVRVIADTGKPAGFGQVLTTSAAHSPVRKGLRHTFRGTRRTGFHDGAEGSRPRYIVPRTSGCHRHGGNHLPLPGPRSGGIVTFATSGQIAERFPEPVTLISRAPRTQSQVTVMISVSSTVSSTAQGGIRGALPSCNITRYTIEKHS